MDSHGADTKKGASVATSNRNGTPYEELPEGQVFSRRVLDDLLYPCAEDKAQGSHSNTNTISVDDARQFFQGDYVWIPSVGNAGEDYRKITDVDEANDEITIAGSTVSLSDGDAIYVDPSRSIDSVQSSNGSGTQISVNDASKFEAGQIVHVGPGAYSLAFDVTAYNAGVYVAEIESEYVVDGQIRTETLRAEYDSSSDSAGTVATELANDFDEYSGVSASTQSTSEVHVDISGRVANHEGGPNAPKVKHRLELQDPNSELSELTGSHDISLFAEIDSVDESNDNITLSDNLKYANGEQIVTEPNGEYRISTETVYLDDMKGGTRQNVLVHYRPIGEVRERVLWGLLPAAKEELKGNIRFNDTAY